MTAYKAWQLLQELYQGSSIANLLDLNTQFAFLHQKAGQTAFQFITEVITLATGIRNIGDDISDQKISFQILGHLLSEFAPLVTTLTNIDGATLNLDLIALREAILREESTLTKLKMQTGATAIPATGPPLPAVPVPVQLPPTSGLPTIPMAHASQAAVATVIFLVILLTNSGAVTLIFVLLV